MFGNNRSHWESIETEVKAWVAERLPVWKVDNTIGIEMLALIPRDILPDSAVGAGPRRLSAFDISKIVADDNERREIFSTNGIGESTRRKSILMSVFEEDD